MVRAFQASVQTWKSTSRSVILQQAGRCSFRLVIDQPGSIAQLALAVAARHGVPVAYVPGLVMRRAADLYPGEAKTGRRDACVLADTRRTRRKQVHWGRRLRVSCWRRCGYSTASISAWTPTRTGWLAASVTR
jgi:Transposase